jgi:hypothetical protein
MAPTLRGQANAKIRTFPSLPSTSLASASMATSIASRVSRQSWSKPSPRNHHHSRHHLHNDAETPRSGIISRGGDDIEERDNYTGMVASASSNGASSRGSRDSSHHRSSWGGGSGRRRSSSFLHDQEVEGRDDVESVQRGEDIEEREADGISSMLSLKFSLMQGPQALSAGLKANSDDTHVTHDTSVTIAASIRERGTPFDESSDDGSSPLVPGRKPPTNEAVLGPLSTFPRRLAWDARCYFHREVI